MCTPRMLHSLSWATGHAVAVLLGREGEQQLVAEIAAFAERAREALLMTNDMVVATLM
jgi:hypothetical protein